MRIIAVFLLCCAPVVAVNPTRVLLLVNDATPAESGTGGVGASLWVAQHYASVRGVPAGNIFHVTAATTEGTSYSPDYLNNIETPLLTYLNANSGLMKQQILYIVPCYGIPVSASTGNSVAVDALLAGMYYSHANTGSTSVQPQINFYNVAANADGTNNTLLWTNRTSPPPYFESWSDTTGATKMFAVIRLDGQTAVLASGLVDKSVAAESSLVPAAGSVYWNWEGTRNNTEFQLFIDTRLRDGAGVMMQNKGISGSAYLHQECTVGTSCNATWEPLPSPYTGTLQQAGSSVYTSPPAIGAFSFLSWPASITYPSWVTGAIAAGFVSCDGGSVRTPPGGGSDWQCSWTGSLVANGITATFGCISEPGNVPGGNYHPSGIDVMQYLYSGYNFGDAFYLSNPSLRWVIYAIGDPLYQPNGMKSQRSITSRSVRISGGNSR